MSVDSVEAPKGSDGSRNIRVLIDRTPEIVSKDSKIAELEQEIGKKNEIIQSFMVSEKAKLQKEIHEEDVRKAELVNQGKPAPIGGDTAPLFQDEHYWKDGDFKVEPTDLIPRHVTSDNAEDLYAYISHLAKDGNIEAHAFLSKQGAKLLKSGKTAQLDGGLSKYTLINGQVIKNTKKPSFRILDSE